MRARGIHRGRARARGCGGRLPGGHTAAQRHHGGGGRHPASATIASGDFFLDFLTTALDPPTVLTRIEDSGTAGRRGLELPGSWRTRLLGYAIVGVAVLVTVGGDGNISRSASRRDRDGRGALASGREVEQALRGASADDDAAITRRRPT